MTVYEVIGNVGADENDIVLWSITLSDEPTDLPQVIEYEVGVPPSGYEEQVALDGEIPADSLIGVEIRKESADPYMGFRLEELRPGSILRDDDYLSEAQFVDQALDTCPG